MSQYSKLSEIDITEKKGRDEPDADFSSYFTIQNNFTKPLILKDFGADTGAWVGEPPQSIRGGALSPVMQIKDNFGAYGSSGFVTYEITTDDGSSNLTATVSCPTTGSNKATFKADNPSIASTTVGPYNESGHPLTVTFTTGPQ